MFLLVKYEGSGALFEMCEMVMKYMNMKYNPLSILKQMKRTWHKFLVKWADNLTKPGLAFRTILVWNFGRMFFFFLIRTVKHPSNPQRKQAIAWLEKVVVFLKHCCPYIFASYIFDMYRHAWAYTEVGCYVNCCHAPFTFYLLHLFVLLLIK